MLVGGPVADRESFCGVFDVKLQLVLVVQVDDVVGCPLWPPFRAFLKLVLLRLAIFIKSGSFFPQFIWLKYFFDFYFFVAEANRKLEEQRTTSLVILSIDLILACVEQSNLHLILQPCATQLKHKGSLAHRHLRYDKLPLAVLLLLIINRPKLDSPPANRKQGLLSITQGSERMLKVVHSFQSLPQPFF